MFPSNSGSLAMAFRSTRVMNLCVARMIGVWVQKNRMDPSQCRLPEIFCDTHFIDARIVLGDFGLDQFTATWPNLMFVCLFVSLYHSKLGFTDHLFDGMQVVVYLI